MAVVRLEGVTDNIGHSFTVLTAEGEQEAWGFYPKGISRAQFIMGIDVSGEVRHDDAYLKDYNAWVKTGESPSGAIYSERTFDITADQYAAARFAIMSWDTTYNANTMCGTFTQSIVGATGNSLGVGFNSQSQQPSRLYWGLKVGIE